MKRFVFWMVLGIVAVSWFRSHADRQAREYERCARSQLARSLAECGERPDVPGAPHRVEIAPGVFVLRSTDERVIGFVDQDGRPLFRGQRVPQEVRRAELAQRESVGDIPVRIASGARVPEAKIQPPVPPRPHAPKIVPVPPETRTISGRLSATPERARNDARLMLAREVANWIGPEVPRAWKAPARLIDAMVLDDQIKTVEKDLGTLYEASVRANFAPARRTEIVETYHRELVARRLAVLAGILAFVLACLAALAGYIRADEATKGYYTTHLRLAAAAGVGAAGVVIYQLLA
jgi:hypothetical protein